MSNVFSSLGWIRPSWTECVEIEMLDSHTHDCLAVVFHWNQWLRIDALALAIVVGVVLRGHCPISQ